MNVRSVKTSNFHLITTGEWIHEENIDLNEKLKFDEHNKDEL